MERSHKFFCVACQLRFTVFDNRRNGKRKIGCPYCFDYQDVIPFSQYKEPEWERRDWTTKEERELLELDSKGMHPKELVQRFNRSFSSIKKKLFRLKDRHETPLVPRWTSREEHRLKELLEQGCKHTDLPQYFPGRSLPSIKSKISRMRERSIKSMS